MTAAYAVRALLPEGSAWITTLLADGDAMGLDEAEGIYWEWRIAPSPGPSRTLAPELLLSDGGPAHDWTAAYDPAVADIPGPTPEAMAADRVRRDAEALARSRSVPPPEPGVWVDGEYLTGDALLAYESSIALDEMTDWADVVRAENRHAAELYDAGPEPLQAEAEGLGFRVREGGRELLVRPGVRGHRITATADGVLLVSGAFQGLADLGERHAVRRYLADIEGSMDSRHAWGRLAEAALVALEQATPATWSTGLGNRDERAGAAFRCYPLVRAGLTAALVAQRSRMKSHLAMATSLGMLSGVDILGPGLPMGPELVDDVLYVSWEDDQDTLQDMAADQVAGAGLDPAIADRLHILGMGVAPGLDRLAEAVADRIGEGLGEHVHLVLDAAESAIASLGMMSSSGDGWSAGAAALFDAIRSIRLMGRRPTLSCLLLDHARGKVAGDVDDARAWAELTEYGSRRKLDMARSAWKLAVAERGRDGDEAFVRLALGTMKPWPDREWSASIGLRATFRDTGPATFATDLVTFYPVGIEPGTRAARIHDALAKSEGSLLPGQIVDILEAGGHPEDTGTADLDKRVREVLGRHRTSKTKPGAFHQDDDGRSWTLA